MSSAVEICLAQEAKLKDTQVKENAVRFNPTTYQFERWTGSAWSPVGSNIDESNLVHKTGNETISGTKTFNSTIVGSVSGNATSATKLATARTIQTNLASTSTDSFDGTANVTPGVTGILPVANGGTGNSTGKAPSAVIADSATTAESALKDGVGNVIADTYARADDLPKAGLPLGHIYLWPFTTPPDGSIQVNGSIYNRELYSDLWNLVKAKGWYKPESEWQSIAAANGGYCPWYSDGDGSTAFRTPKFAPYQKLALASGDAGKYYEAGLPNITGSINTDGTYGGDFFTSSSGSFSNSLEVQGWRASTHQFTITGASPKVFFDASRSSLIYGNSTTVQPESHGWIVCVVAFGTATNVGSVDVANVMSAIGQVQAIPHIVETWIYRDKICWYRRYSDGWIEQGGSYVRESTDTSETKTITLNTAFSNTYYTLITDHVRTNTSTTAYAIKEDGYYRKERTYFSFYRTTNLSYDSGTCWYACGY